MWTHKQTTTTKRLRYFCWKSHLQGQGFSLVLCCPQLYLIPSSPSATSPCSVNTRTKKILLHSKMAYSNTFLKYICNLIKNNSEIKGYKSLCPNRQELSKQPRKQRLFPSCGVGFHYLLSTSNLTAQVRNTSSFCIFGPCDDDSLLTRWNLELCRRHICRLSIKMFLKRFHWGKTLSECG